MGLYGLLQRYVVRFHHSLSLTTHQSRLCFFGITFFIFSTKQERSLDNKVWTMPNCDFR